MQSLETISCWVLWQCGNHFSATELQNCHFPSLSPTIDGDGGQGCRLKEKNHQKKMKSGKSVLEWRKITISLHFAATIEVVVIWSQPTKESFLWGLLLY